ncbi:MAG TPA: YdeI/OmpD-associated family protein [Kofleriaceae bacterium]|jgi:uncharacterized protein YdeI (YjbR/CyaY-like superfamily)|nr:YdeI/OmpD-associated family protein [Kofleriaceae bacterium]
MSGPDKNMQALQKQQMPGFVRKALEKRNLVDAFRARPAYQQNDYLFWISQAKLEPQKQQRLTQMIDELDKGNAFKGAPWEAPKKPA